MKKLRQRKANAATTSFWTALEQKAEPVLLHDVAVNSAKYWSNDSHWLARSPWGREVIRAAKDAYDFSCPHATPRQIRAYAAGLVTLVRPDIVKSEAADRTEETEDTTET